MKSFGIVALALSTVSLSAPSVAQPDPFDMARTKIRDVMIAHHIPSVTVAVAHQGKVVWQEGFGWADIEQRIPATPDTRYSLASISKPITATAVMTLVERGLIDLDKPIDDYLGHQKLAARVGSASDATVRRVAGHTAGLPLHARFFYADELEAGPPPAMDETIRRYGTLVSEPGEAHVYSNLGYGLLEYAIERASGKSYAQYLHDELFVPLGLTSGVVNPRPDAGGADPGGSVASRYWLHGGEVPHYDFDQLAGGGVVMSAHDLVRFGLFHLQGRLTGQSREILQRETLAGMREPLRLNDGSESGYGIGWFTGEQHGMRWFGHNGGMAGVATVLSIYPENDAVIVVLANGVSRTGAVHFLESDIVHALFPETIRHDHGFKPRAELVGRWRGQIHTHDGNTDLELDFKENGSVFVRVGKASLQEVSKVRLDEKTSFLHLEELIGDLGTRDAAHHPGRLQLSLKLRAPNTLNGSISSNSLETLSDRMGSAVSHWVELNRDPTDG